MKRIIAISILTTFISVFLTEVATSTKADAACWHVRNYSKIECCKSPNC
jgi:hypothetical protein